MELCQTTGTLIKKFRNEKGITQKELASTLGVSYQMVQSWERGARNPKRETIEKIAAALGIPGYKLLPNSSYLEHLAQAKEEVEGELWAEEVIARDEGHPWDIWTYNDNREKKIYIIAPKYSVDPLALSYEIPKRGEAIDPDIQKVGDIMQTMNATGRRVAVERVQELAQIPAYQAEQTPNKK